MDVLLYLRKDKTMIRVHCGKCKKWIPEKETKFLNIEEDIQGADVLTFECPECKTTQRSRRYG
jgi:uncharacterized Zn finger protein (UPF0148 family)